MPDNKNRRYKKIPALGGEEKTFYLDFQQSENRIHDHQYAGDVEEDVRELPGEVASASNQDNQDPN